MSRKRLGASAVVAVPRLHHGLGNRVRLVLSALALAQSQGREFAYVWPTGKPFGASFTDLWESDLRRIRPLHSLALSARYPYRDAELTWMPTAMEDRVWQIRSSQPLALEGGPEVWHQLLRDLRPVEPVRTRIRRYHTQWFEGQPYFGAMVRTHAVSHEITLRDSPVEWYLDTMSDYRRLRPDMPWFVSADNPETQARVVSAFPNAFALEDKGVYNSREALQASLVDLHLLASSAHLIGPHYSSFPELAQFLAGPRLILETSQSGSTPPQTFDIVDDPVMPSHRRLWQAA